MFGGTSPIRISFFYDELALDFVCLYYGDFLAELSILYMCACVGEVSCCVPRPLTWLDECWLILGQLAGESESSTCV